MIVERIPDPPLPRAALCAFADAPRPFLLESTEVDGDLGRYSFAGADPFLTLTSRGRTHTVSRGGKTVSRQGDVLDTLRALLAEFRLPAVDAPMACGAVGFFAYDLGRTLERLPATAHDDLGLPDVCLDFHDVILAWDHGANAAWIISTGLPARGEAAVRRARARVDAMRARLAAAGRPDPLPRPSPAEALRSTFSREDYVTAVRRAQDYIAAGDIFQVNLSQRFRVPVVEPGRVVYDHLATANPAPFAAYLTSPCGAEVVSASPERYLRVDGRHLETRPIKGTRPRGATPDEDCDNAGELLASAKDRAELVMIVDLMRSDVGKVARFGSVAVTEFPVLTSHPTVHHLHGTVVAELAEGRDVTDLIRASFPGGSITGAPKVRAMEIIEEFEPLRRGVYTGSIGYFGFDGRADLNIAIRTLVVKDGAVTFSVGGGIVADSDPEKEYEETLHKGRGLARALGLAL